MSKSKRRVLVGLFIVIADIIVLSSCGEYKQDIDDERRWQDELVDVVGVRSPEFMIIWRWYYNRPEIYELPRKPGHAGWACLLADRSALVMRRPIEELRILEGDEDCPWLSGDFEVDE